VYGGEGGGRGGVESIPDQRRAAAAMLTKKASVQSGEPRFSSPGDSTLSRLAWPGPPAGDPEPRARLELYRSTCYRTCYTDSSIDLHVIGHVILIVLLILEYLEQEPI